MAGYAGQESKPAISLPPGSNMRDIFDLCQKHGIPSLAQGMIELPPPLALRQKAAEVVLRDDIHTYRTRMGQPEFTNAISALVKKAYGEVVPPENVLAVAGVAGGVSAALLHLRGVKPDAKVAVMEPFYTYHALEVERAFKSMPVVIPAVGDNAEPGLDELKALVEANEVHGVIITSPVNPTGLVYTPEQIKMLVGLSDTHGLFLIMDECYLDMTFNGKVHPSPFVDGNMRDNVVACRGFSKCMGCQSWRVGYAISSRATLEGMMKMMDPLYICANWTQHALGEYLGGNVEDFLSHIKDCNQLIQDNWNVLKVAFQSRFGWIPLEPDGTMYGMFKHSEKTDIIACEAGLAAGVGVCPGNIFFGLPGSNPENSGWVRIHCGITREKANAIAKALTSDMAKGA